MLNCTAMSGIQRQAITFRRCEVSDIINLRYDVLCAGRPRVESQFDGDDGENTHHFAAFQAKDSAEFNVGCVSYMLNAWNDQPAWQLRGMAILPELAGQGIGTKLVGFAEGVLREASPVRQMWCNARVPAIPFYERLGWIVASDEFVVPNYDAHRKMTAMLR